jgi:hypothetical protein
MSTRAFLVERYWPGINEAGLRAALPRLARATRAITSDGRTVEHVGSLLMAADQVVFSVFRAESEATAIEVTTYGFAMKEGRKR